MPGALGPVSDKSTTRAGLLTHLADNPPRCTDLPGFVSGKSVKPTDLPRNLEHSPARSTGLLSFGSDNSAKATTACDSMWLEEGTGRVQLVRLKDNPAKQVPKQVPGTSVGSSG